MARVEAVPQNCIYMIRAGAHYYIGQTTRGTERIDEHIRQAYYHGNITGIYKHMQHQRMMDLEITYYEAPNYGIENFSQAGADFQSEGKSVGTMNAIDFAEIFHIMRAIRENKILENTSMGGQSMGYQYIGPSSYHAGKTLMRTMTPEEAYGVLMLGGAQSSLLASVTTTLYQEMFSPDGKNIYQQKYQTIYPNATASELETFKDVIYNQIVPILAQHIQRIGGKGKNHINPNSPIHAALKDGLNHKQKLATAILQAWFRNNKIQCPVNISQQLDFSQLTDYLIDVLNRGSYALLGHSSKNITQQIQDFRPIRTSVVWKWSSLKKPHTYGLVGYSTKKGTPVSADYLKYRSFLLFERTIQHVQKGDFSNLEFRNKSFDSQLKPVKNAYFHPNGEQTLSAKMHAFYYAAYQDNGLEFYRPMVAKGRKYHNYPEFRNLVTDDEITYRGYPSQDGECYILYKNKNIINSESFMNGSEIKIY